MSDYYGDIRLGDTIDIKFTTRQISGAPFTLASSPVISAYPSNSTTQLTAGITLSVDFDSVTGYNNVRVVASSGNGYATATNYDLCITTGTVNSVSVVGESIGSFSIENRSSLMPTTAARTLDVSAGGEAGVDWANVGSPTTTVDLSGTTIKTTQKVDVDTIKTQTVTAAGGITFPAATLASTTNITAGTITTASNVTTVNGLASGVITNASLAADTGLHTIRSNTAAAGGATSITLDASASASDNFYNNDIIYITGGTGIGQARFITAYVGATQVATVGAWVTAPDNTSTFAILPFDAVAGATAPTAAQIATAVWQDSTGSDFTAASSIGKSLYTSGVVPGGSGGLLISGSNSGTTTFGAVTVTGALTVSAGIVVTQSSSNAAGVSITGNGSGAGISATGGSTGNGMSLSGGATSGMGLLASGTGSSSIGARILGAGTGAGFSVEGGATGRGMQIIGGSTSGIGLRILTTDGNAVDVLAVGASRHGVVVQGGNSGTSDGMKLTAGTGGVSLRAAGGIVGDITGNLSGFVGSIAAAGITRASYAAETGDQTVRSNTAAAGSGTTITLDAGASAVDNFYTGEMVYLTGGTGVGQARFITNYVGATQVATVATWITNPDNTTTFAIIPFGTIPGATAPTAAQVATAVWQDTTAGDFTTAGSIGKSLFTSGNVPGAANGLLIAGANAATTFATLTSTGAFTINGTSDVAQTGDSFARIGATGSGLTSLAPSATALSTVQWTNGRAADLDNLDVAVSTRLASASYTTPPTAAQNADALLGRNIAGGSNTGRIVSEALYFLRNKWTVSAGTLTVYGDDDTTVSWTSAVSTDAAAVPIIGNDPA